MLDHVSVPRGCIAWMTVLLTLAISGCGDSNGPGGTEASAASGTTGSTVGSSAGAGGAGGAGATSGSGGSGNAGGAGAASGSGGSGNTGGAGAAGGGGPVEPMGTSLLVQVLDSGGNPIPSAVVTVQGNLLPTDGAGYIFFDNLMPGRFTARVESYGYAPASVVVELPSGTHGGTAVHLIALGPPLPFDSSMGAVLDQGSVQVTIPPDSLVDHNGAPVIGMVDATIVPLDPTQGLTNVPGPLEGITTANGDTVALESMAMAEVSLRQNGVPVQLAPGKTATLELVLSDTLAGQVQIGDTIEAWWLDLDAGIWKEEGAGMVQMATADPGKLAWVAQVGHFTWWNVDKPWFTKNCFDVTVIDSNSAPMPGMLVNAVGVDYTGFNPPHFTQLDGHTCMEIMLGGTANIEVGPMFMPIASTQVTGMGPASDCMGQGAACAPITVMVGAIPICTPGASQGCPYTGPGGTEGVGICQAGTNYCNATGTAWTGCAGEVLPQAEDCNSPVDEDCDGLVNEEGTNCQCVPGSMTSCYSGPPGTLNVGICVAGQRTCQPDGKSYGPCTGEVLPQPESCVTPEDENCDGSTGCGGLAIWSKGIGNSTAQFANNIAVDGASNLIVAGAFDGTVDFGGGPLTTAGLLDIFIAKLDSAGNHLWSNRYGDASPQHLAVVAVDPMGSIIVVGTSAGAVDFGGGPIVSMGPADVVIAKLSSTGAHMWSRRLSLTAPVYTAPQIPSVAVDATGNIAVAGVFALTVDFGGGPLNAQSPTDLFAVKLGPAGNHLWSRRFGNASSMPAFLSHVVTFDGTGNVLVGGGFTATVDFGGGPLPTAGSDDIFVAKLDGAGNHVWSKRFGNGGMQRASAIAADASGNVVISGLFNGTVDFGGAPLMGPYAQNLFVAKLDPAGNHVFSMHAGGVPMPPPLSRDSAVAVDASGNILITGIFGPTVDFGGGPLSSSGSMDMFAAKFAPDGAHLWSHPFGDMLGVEQPGGIAVDMTGQPSIAGSFTSTVDFGNGPLLSAGGQDIFITQLIP